MSEINFKAIRVRTGAWVDCSPTIRNSEVFSNHKELGVVNSYLIDTNTLCQFTGSCDCNGTPIYEGDIVMHKDNNAERRGDINWDSKAAAFCFGQDFLVHYHSEDMVVVGNKFDK